MNIRQQCLRARLQKTMTAQPKDTGLSVASCDKEEKGGIRSSSVNRRGPKLRIRIRRVAEELN